MEICCNHVLFADIGVKNRGIIAPTAGQEWTVNRMRLIDADALAASLGITNMDCQKCDWHGSLGCKRGSDFVAACEAIEDAPTIDTDLSTYSDRLWHIAYERGKAEEQRWIPVSEKLPDEEDEKVLVTDEYGDIDIAWFEFNEWIDDPKVEWWNGEYKVQPTAWMPLPEPYKKDGD